MTSALATLSRINPSKTFKPYLQKCVSLLKDFSSQGSIAQGTILHAHLIKMGISSEKFVAVRLLLMYLNKRKEAEADQIFKDFDGFNLVAHNCLISANVQWGRMDEARRLFDEMPDRNDVSWTVLISGFMKYGRVGESMQYFERNPFRDVVSWTAAICGFVQNGLNYEALKLFLKLLHSRDTPNVVTFTSVLRACAEAGEFEIGMSVLGLIVKAGFEHHLSICNSLITLHLRMGNIDLAKRMFDSMKSRDIVSWTAILDVYIEMGDIKETRHVFDEMPDKNEVSWSVMIARYSQSGCTEEALSLFCQMIRNDIKPNISCASSLLSALAAVKALRPGICIHGLIKKVGLQENVFVGSSLVDLYCKCGKPRDGRLVFDLVLDKNVVLWNSMISGYSLNGHLEEAEELFRLVPKKDNVSWNSIMAGYVECQQYDKVLELFDSMLFSGEKPNRHTFSSVLCACASMASLNRGLNIHAKAIKFQVESDVYVGTALADMYAKSGNIESCRQIFDRMPDKDEVPWTVMIQGLAENGLAEQSLLYFEEMEKTSSVVPNDLMLLAVLFACSHCGLVDKGLWYFNSMEKVYGVKPRGRHYTCVVDMLSRSGRLSEAENFLNSMPFEPEVNAWAALLSGCKTYKNEEMAERIARKLLDLAEKNSAGYILLSNIYASSGKWFNVSNVRKSMGEKGLKKSTGVSWVEVKNQFHSFYSDDANFSQLTDIYEILELLRSEMLV